MSKLSSEQLKRLYPRASASFLKANSGDGDRDPQAAVARPVDEDTREVMRTALLHGIRPTTDEAKLNKLETRYLAWLEALHPFWIGVQCITLKLGHDCRYTPDFWALDKDGLRAMDTKGEHTWEDALIKIRVAARLYPWIRFVLVKQDGDVWQHKDIKP